MTHEQRLFKVMSAVRECLQTCCRSGAPDDVVKQFTERLRSDPCWNDSEVQEVESTAKLAIARMNRDPKLDPIAQSRPRRMQQEW